MLTKKTTITDRIELIPNTGIQFVDFALDLANFPKKSWDFCITPGEEGQLFLLEEDPETGAYSYNDSSGHTQKASEPTFSVSLKEIIGLFEDQWLPLPYLREQQQAHFANGPTNWVRGRFVDIGNRLEASPGSAESHRLVIAFDTALLPHRPDADYLAPSADDAKAGRVFSLATHASDTRDFVNAGWLGDWLFELYADRVRARQKKHSKPVTDDEVADYMVEMHDVNCFEIATYLAYLDALRLGLRMLPVKFTDVTTDQNITTIDVDLVLDLGNSRTCGILIEEHPDEGFSLKTASELRLRDLSRPEFIYQDPFESWVEFAQVSFGKDHFSPLSGRSDAFQWPTIARVGGEAARLSSLREGTSGHTGMSSPKRYLWDERKRVQPWRFNRGADQVGGERFAKDGAFAALINSEGKPRHTLDPIDPENLPPVEAKYSRSSIVTFALAEILYHAILMINSPDYRRQKGHYSVPRNLRRVILTMPTAMSKPERDIFRDRAKHAIDMTMLVMKRPRESGPKLEMLMDEASATQLVYLYTEVAKTFNGDARGFFKLMKTPRIDDPRPERFRLATIDIGGGTTDLVITDFEAVGAGTSANIRPHAVFREGFNVAGDDILRRVVNEHVLAPIQDAIAAAGVIGAGDLIEEIFGGDSARKGITESVERQQLVMEVLVKIGLAILGAYESSNKEVAKTPTDLGFAEIFSQATPPPERRLLRFNEKVIENGGQPDFDLRKLRFPVDPETIRRTITNTLGNAFPALCEVIRAYDCDVLLLSGRPSRLPALRELVISHRPVTPDRIIPLHHYRVGNWYPFRDSRLRISDPKTTAVVGAMIGAVASGRLLGFGLLTDQYSPISTARYIGKIDTEQQIKDQDVYYADVDLENPEEGLPPTKVPFANKVVIGFRQLPLERWPATQMYVLDYRDDKAAQRYRTGDPLQVSFSIISKRDESTETLKIKEILTSEGDDVGKTQLALRLQTLQDQSGYWFDTGVIR